MSVRETELMDSAIFREVLSTFPAGVVIVTAVADDGTPAGLTISAFSSVSAEPALILICVDVGSKTLPAIQSSGKFTVNILAAGREELALKFASKRPDKYEGVTWEAPMLDGGGPVLVDDVASYLVCRVHQEVVAGDHHIFIGAPVEAGLPVNSPPLLYHRRGFTAIAV